MGSSPGRAFTIQQFQAKWRGVTLKERSASQEHFLDLCRALGMPTPADEDKTGAFYTFEKGAAKSGGGKGFADVWWEGKFGWEYKGLHADLTAAYRQLLQYREDLGNPPLLIVCDLDRFEIHTNFTGTKKVVHAFTLDELVQPATLDPNQRAQLGAYYTGRADIERVVEPVVMTPLRRRWDAVRTQADKLKDTWTAAATPQTRRNRRDEFASCLHNFQQDLTGVRILDPACGSGNFLYVALAKLLDLEKEVLVYGATNGLALGYPLVSPAQLAGLEINEYARELAQVAIWIGYLQWRIGNGFSGLPDPILEPLETIRLQDALLDRTDPDHPKEAIWPAANFIIGNPPFLGGNKVRQELGDEYLDDLFAVYDQKVPRFADLVCYFFEQARADIAGKRAKRAGLLATNSIRGGVNREVLERIKETGDIFMAWSDEPWILNGAALRISIVGFDDGEEEARFLNSNEVESINADLTTSVDLTVARKLIENANICFYGSQQKGSFEIDFTTAQAMLSAPRAFGRDNRDVVKRSMNGAQLLRRTADTWVIDFGVDTSLSDAMLYEAPFEHIRRVVLPEREFRNERRQRELWWLHARPSPRYRRTIAEQERYLVSPALGRYRIFAWLDSSFLADHQLIVFARQDDYFFGVLHSRAYEVWSLRMGTWLGVGNDPRYTPATCFETFPLPWPPGREPWRDERLHAIANAARDLDEKRRKWLDPAEIGAAELKKRTLTNLYNQRPAWLEHAHAGLDRAVWTAYGWDDADLAAVADDTILERLLALNQRRAATPAPTLPSE